MNASVSAEKRPTRVAQDAAAGHCKQQPRRHESDASRRRTSRSLSPAWLVDCRCMSARSLCRAAGLWRPGPRRYRQGGNTSFPVVGSGAGRRSDWDGHPPACFGGAPPLGHLRRSRRRRGGDRDPPKTRTSTPGRAVAAADAWSAVPRRGPGRAVGSTSYCFIGRQWLSTCPPREQGNR